MKEQLKEVRHDYIRYANCWEDADVLLAGLDVQNGDRILSIGSAGDNSFSMLVHNPELVVAVDINPIQLKLIELKKAAFATLDYSEFLQFLGFKESDQRWELFLKVSEGLTPELVVFWESRKEEIIEGIIFQGKFEKYFKLFQKKVLPLVHRKKTVNHLMTEKTGSEQKDFYLNTWNNWRWKLLFKIFFSKFVMGRFGRDPKFLNEVKVPVAKFILGQVENHMTSTVCQRNYFLHFILQGNFGDLLPHYAREENFHKIKSRINRLEIYEGLAEDAFKEYDGFNKFNLSNIFEYMDPELFHSVGKNFIENGLPNSRYAYWNLMVPRKLSGIQNSGLRATNSQDLIKVDKGFFYNKIQIDIKS
jgi:S-adenosylmethionine-diacylglycerol 3-amino-3-carboxypropyl transferase